MAGMELPLLSPPTSEAAPGPVVTPHNEAFERIDAAGSELRGAAENLWYMGRMARMNEQEAGLNHLHSLMEDAAFGVNQGVQNGTVTPDDAPGVMRKAIGDATKDYLGQSSGSFRDRATAMVEDATGRYVNQSVVHATAEKLQRSNAQYKNSLNALIGQIPFTDQANQPALIQQLHASIDSHGQINHLPSETVQMEHAVVNARLQLGFLQKGVNEAPGHAISELTSPDFDSKNQWLGLVGGEGMKQKLIGQANAAIKDGDAVANARITQARQGQLDQLFAMHDNGQMPSDQQLNQMTLVPNNVKQFFKPSWHPQPPGNPALFGQLMDMATSAKDPADVNLIRMRGVGELNPDESKQLNDSLNAHVSMNKTSVGQAYQAALADISSRYNPVMKNPGFLTSEQRAQRQHIANAAAQAFKASMKGNENDAAVIKAKDQIYKQFDQYLDKKQRQALGLPGVAEKPVGREAVSGPGLPVDYLHMSDADRVKALGLK